MPVKKAERLGAQAGLVAKTLRVAHALRGESVEMRRLDVLRAVAAEVVRNVLADQPEDVWAPTRRGRHSVRRSGGPQTTQCEIEERHSS